MAASMDINVQMDQIMSLGRPTRKAKDDANSKIIITDSNFQHSTQNNVNTSAHIHSTLGNHYNSYFNDNDGDVMSLNVDENYGNYNNVPMNINPDYGTVEYGGGGGGGRAKPFDIATINHTDQTHNKQIDDVAGNMGPPVSKKRRGRQPNQNNQSNETETENTLYGAIRFGRVPIQTLIDEWIEQYNINREPAMLDLMQFFISCCGCKGKITSEILSQMSQAVVIRKLTEEFDEDNGEYPLIQTSPQAKRFKTNFVDFIQIFIRQCQYSIIYDQYLIDQITSLLTVLTDSQVRAFRHTGTLAAMKLMTALVDVALNITINRDNNHRQLEAERSKNQSNRTKSERLQILTRRQHELDENMTEVKNMLTFLVKGVFVHRYRDSQAEIRSICMQEIGVWMYRYPQIFLDDSYLKYVGWTLYDRVGSVRAQCLKTLQPLYEEPNLVSNLELFTNRFKSRLVDMTLDKEVEVAVLAVKVVSCILKHSELILEDRDCENIYELVYCTNRNLAQAAGEFLSQKLFQIDLNVTVTKSRKGKKRSENTPLIRDLVQFFIESELHEHAGYLVDSLWDVCPMIKDWECMVDLLLEEAGKGEQTLTSAQETSLIEILYWCVRQASTGESPVGRQSSSSGHHHQATIPAPNLPGSGAGGAGVGGTGGGAGGGTGGGPGGGGGGGTGKSGRVLSSKEAKAISEDRNKFTEILIPALPVLMSKYGEDVPKMTNIVQLPLFMNLDLYTSGRHERYLDLLIKYLQEMVERHTDFDVLLYISQVFESLCCDELSISTKCQAARGTLLDRLVDTYRRSYSQYYNSPTEEPSQDDAYRLHSSIKRLSALYAMHDLKSLDLWDSLIRVSQSAQNQAVFHEEIVSNAIATCYTAVMWQLSYEEGQSLSSSNKTLNDHHQHHHHHHQNHVVTVRKNLQTFIKICQSYLDHQSHLISQESYKSICDLLIVCSTHMITEQAELKSSVYIPDADLQNTLVQYLENRVFIDDDAEEDENIKIEELHNRRTNLAMFFKLIVYNVFPIKAASHIYKFYLRFFNDFGDIMKAGLAKAREINRLHTAKMVMECLISGLNDLMVEQSGFVDRSTEGFQSLKELARRLNLSFGLDLMKIREAMMELHKMAIDTVLNTMSVTGPSRPPSNLLCLELAAEFSNKLIGSDKKFILESINKAFPNPADNEGWISLYTYRMSLDPDAMDNASTHNDSCHSGTGSSAQNIITPQPRSRGRPKKIKDPATSIVQQQRQQQSQHQQRPPVHSTAIKKRKLNHSINSVSVVTAAHPSINVSSIDGAGGGGGGAPNMHISEEPSAQTIPRVSIRGRILKNRISLSLSDQASDSQ